MKAEVTAESKNPTKVEVDVRGYSFEIDEPEEMGGTGSAPNPVEYELGSLTGCLNVVSHLVAKEMDIEIESLQFTVSGELDPSKYEGKNDDVRAGFQSVEVDVDIESDANQSQLEELFDQVEERCPVSDNISHETPVEINL